MTITRARISIEAHVLLHRFHKVSLRSFASSPPAGAITSISRFFFSLLATLVNLSHFANKAVT